MNAEVHRLSKQWLYKLARPYASVKAFLLYKHHQHLGDSSEWMPLGLSLGMYRVPLMSESQESFSLYRIDFTNFLVKRNSD